MTRTKTFLLPGLALAALLGAPSAMADLTGTVLHFDGSALADVPVRARNADLGVDARARTDENGRYEFADIPAGTYLITVNPDCCLFLPYANEAVEVAADGSSDLDIQLAAFNVNVEGDNPNTVNTELATRNPIPDLPVPTLDDGTPDLSGVWVTFDDPYPEPVPARDWAQAEFEQRAGANFIDIPAAHCLPGGFPIGSGAAFITRFVQRPDFLAILFEDVANFRQVYLDGREFPERIDPSWRGYSIGRWEGDMLVIETRGFNDRGITQNYPRTTDLHIEERYRRTSYGELEVQVTYDDPAVFTAPWSQNMVWRLAPDTDLMEYVCENNQWIDTYAEDVGLAPQ